MLDWFFKRPPPLGSKPAPAPARPSAAAPIVKPAAPASKPTPQPKPKAQAPDWRPQLQAALGDEAALLKLALSSVPLEAKLAAVAELSDEAALKQAERHFRSHDRRVHQLAKQRLNARVALRETLAKAGTLIDEAHALLQDPLLPVNRLVELDRAWQALEDSLLSDSLRGRWAELMQQLTNHTRDRGERELQFKRWTAQVREALPALHAACRAVAADEQARSHLTHARERASELRAAAPAEAADAAAESNSGKLLAELEQAVQAATALDERLVLLEALLASNESKRDADPAAAPLQAPPVADRAAPRADAVETAALDLPVPPAERATSETDAQVGDPAKSPTWARVDGAVEATAETPVEAAVEALPEAGPETGPETAIEPRTDASAEAASEVSVQDHRDTEPPDEAGQQAGAAAETPDHLPVETAPEAPAGPTPTPAPTPAPVPRRSLLQQWQALPPLPDAALAGALARRVAQWQQAQDDARSQRRMQQRNQARDQQRALRSEKIVSLAGLLDEAEAALDGGHLEDTHRLLLAMDELLHGGTPDTGLRGRIDQVQARYAQLKGWQHWAGGRARDELTQQAEALAAVVGGTDEPRTVKLSIQQQADVIDDMRARWKELDRLGGATSRALWQRFDSALKTAYEPVAAHLAKLRAVREQNLATRRQLIESLLAVPLPGEEADGAAPADTPWRPLADALAQFHTEWRKLGPVEHTVPRKAQAALLEQMTAAVQRAEAPLQQARSQAQGAREQLIQRARTLAEQAAAGTAGRDTGQQVRELQATWQQQAKALPLQRGVENALWNDFKSAIDGIFSARDAVFNAREAEFKGHAAQRLALIEQLEAVSPEITGGELKRQLSEMDQAWQRCGPAPRQDAAALDARWRHARDAAQQLLDNSARRRWHGLCDAMDAKLALCAALPQAEGSVAADPLQTRWDALPELPPAWEQALRLRAGLPAATLVPSPGSADDWLLQLEAAWDQPSPPEQQSARRQLKLQALKSAMEGRRSVAPPPPELLLADLLRHEALNPAQLARRDALLRALRERGGAYPA